MNVTVRVIQPLILLLSAVSIVAGCATASGPAFSGWVTPSDGNGVLYVYRPWSYINSAVSPRLYVDGVQKGKLENGGYHALELRQGSYIVATDGGFIEWPPGRAEVSVSVVSGKASFVRLGSGGEYVGSGLVITSAGLSVVDKAIARAELPKTKRSQ